MCTRHHSGWPRLAAALIAAVMIQRPAKSQTMTPRPDIEFRGSHIALDSVGRPVNIATSPSGAFMALTVAYAELQIPLTLVDSARGTLGTLRLVRTQSLAGAPLSRLIDCGSSMSGPFADNARVALAIVSFLTPGSRDSISLRTAVVGLAESIDGTSREPVLCSSTGFLESRIRRAVIALITGPR